MITADEARRAGVCRVCRRPINHPSEKIVWENEDYPCDRGERVSVRNGSEYAHSACADGVLAFPTQEYDCAA